VSVIVAIVVDGGHGVQASKYGVLALFTEQVLAVLFVTARSLGSDWEPGMDA
jgi:hypothetical protein